MSPENKGFVNREMRDLILEATDLADGRISEQDLRDYVIKSRPQTTNMSISQLLRYMQRDEEITITGDWIRRKQVPPQGKDVVAEVAWKAMSDKYQQADNSSAKAQQVSYANGTPPADERRVSIPDFYKGRQGKKLVIERNREEIDDVFRLEYQLASSAIWHRIPTWDNIHVSIGVEQAVLDPEQEVYTDIRKLRVTFTDGRQRVWDDLNPRDHVVIAPME